MVSLPPNHQATRDSSAGRAEDCSWMFKQRSLGRWFKSASRDGEFWFWEASSVTYVCYNARAHNNHPFGVLAVNVGLKDTKILNN